ncbi:efflux RND transporter permease subunit [Lewinella sp. IMCC34183]|uniref:efflux RND transporter permease subunit n=1 Tax=Lewinella sp. IMCC34183 TaxID=2248762 RepID=UPI000E24411E|nr:MMPL family transporter [Lewinella sp. IMCC34183]
MRRYRLPVLVFFALYAALAVYGCFRLNFSFDFQQFFPQGDEDLEFFLDFIEEFEGDDNFLLVALEREPSVFDSSFLAQVQDFSIAVRDVPGVEAAQSLTSFGYPIKTPFAITTIPAIHLDEPGRYAADSARIMQDERFVGNLINRRGTALVTVLKTPSLITLDQSRALVAGLDSLVATYDFPAYHYLGPAYFQKELVDVQIREVAVSAIVSGLLVTLVMFFLFRRPLGIAVALVSIALGLLLFMGTLGVLGRELNTIAALYPVLMIIVGTSDVIHIMSKYIDELRKGHPKEEAIRISIKEIGLATLLTSLTTAVGFATLLTSRVNPIRDFGINAAIGVMIAYLTVILFTTSLLSYLSVDQIVKIGRQQAFWDRLLERTYQFTQRRSRAILVGALATVALCAYGISQITTNYRIESTLPNNRKVTEDFRFFERELSGFRPFELAVTTRDSSRVTDFDVLTEIGKIEDHVRQFPFVQSTASITAVYRSINQAFNNNRADAYVLPATEARYRQYRTLAERVPDVNLNLLVSRDRQKARITSRLDDIGADSIKVFLDNTNAWINANVDTSLVEVRSTGTGLIIDKNAEYIRRNLLQGLGLAILIVCILMALLFRSWRMLVISLIPNLLPLLIAGAMLGYLGIELEAGVSIVFAIIFGIAVDDTIHFLSKYKLARRRGLGVTEAIHLTFRETGKAIVLTSVVLFFGFLVMLFSISPPSVTIGLLISLTLASALVSDLLLIPLLLRWLER